MPLSEVELFKLLEKEVFPYLILLVLLALFASIVPPLLLLGGGWFLTSYGLNALFDSLGLYGTQLDPLDF